MRNLLALVLLLVLAASGILAADAALIALAPANSSVLIGVNVRELLNSELGREIMGQARLDSPDLKAFIEKAGFDPFHDISEILIAAPAQMGKQKSRGLFMIRGSFDPTRFAELAVDPTLSATTFRGVTVLTKQQAEPMSFACLDRSLMIGGDPESVRSAISRRGSPAGLDVAFVTKAVSLSRTYDIWLSSRISPALLADIPNAPPSAGPQMELIKSIEQASGGLKFGTDLLLAAEIVTKTPKDAESIAAVIRMVAGLAASNGRDAKKAAALLEKLALRTEGNTLSMSLTIPEAELRKSIQASVAAAMQRGATPAAEPAAEPAPEPVPTAPTEIKIYSSPRDMGNVTIPPPKPQ